MWIETIMHMSGTRANGEKYPPGWTPFEVEDWEGEHLIKGGMARRVNAPPARERKDPQPHPPEVPVPGQDDLQPYQVPDAPVPVPPAPRSEPSATAAGPTLPNPSAGPPPPPNAPKDAWVNYAVSQGMDGDAASRATKADLQSRYGPRL